MRVTRPQSSAVGGVDLAAGEEHVAGPGDADLAGQDRGVAGVGDAPEHLGGPERGAVEATATSESMAINSPPPWQMPFTAATTGLRRVADRVERDVVHVQQSGQVGPAVLLVAAEVAAGDEHVVGAGDDEGGQLVGAVDVVDRVADPEVHRRGHRVAAVGPVDRADGQRAAAFEAQERRARASRRRVGGARRTSELL